LSDKPREELPGIEEDLDDLFENAPCGYVSTLPSGKICKVNRTFCDWTQYEAADVLGKRFQDFLNIAGKIYFETHFAPLLRMQGFFNEVALDLVRRDGQAIPGLINAVEKRSGGDVPHFIRLTISTRQTGGGMSANCSMRGLLCWKSTGPSNSGLPRQSTKE
jgi:PAS domain S-box-containing protein